MTRAQDEFFRGFLTACQFLGGSPAPAAAQATPPGDARTAATDQISNIRRFTSAVRASAAMAHDVNNINKGKVN